MIPRVEMPGMSFGEEDIHTGCRKPPQRSAQCPEGSVSREWQIGFRCQVLSTVSRAG